MTQQRVVKRRKSQKASVETEKEKRRKNRGMKEQRRGIKVSSRKRKKHIGEKLWKSRMLARCFNRTCMDMLSVGVCDRMSVHTLTVLAGEKKRISLLHQSGSHASPTP